jgi:hypothetical protein
MNNPLSGTDPTGYRSDVKVDSAACNDRDLAGRGDSAEFTVRRQFSHLQQICGGTLIRDTVQLDDVTSCNRNRQPQH